jgi:mono/diheme cytochrome c family protein
MPKVMGKVILLLAVLSLVPLALIARARTERSGQTRLHPVSDMDHQPRYKAQQASELFADGRAMRPKIEGTVARGEPIYDPTYYYGYENHPAEGEEPPWIEKSPVEADMAVLERGKQRYEIFCATCHGLTGDGQGPTAVRATELQESAWIPPTSMHDPTVLARPDGHIFNTISHGIRTMPAYGTQIPVPDRWAIVAYVRALQVSRQGDVEEIPAEPRRQLESESVPQTQANVEESK